MKWAQIHEPFGSVQCVGFDCTKLVTFKKAIRTKDKTERYDGCRQ